jgi:predicted nucleic acid-binding protein
MNGRVLLDTNAVINGIKRGVFLPKADYAISIITEIELFAYPKISEEEERILKRLLSNFTIYPLDEEIKEETISLRRRYGLKLPDCIICATAKSKESLLISDDLALQRVQGLAIERLETFVGS